MCRFKLMFTKLDQEYSIQSASIPFPFQTIKYDFYFNDQNSNWTGTGRYTPRFLISFSGLRTFIRLLYRLILGNCFFVPILLYI